MDLFSLINPLVVSFLIPTAWTPWLSGSPGSPEHLDRILKHLNRPIGGVVTPKKTTPSLEWSTVANILTYCGWKKSCTTLDGWNPINNGINHLSTGVRFLPSTVGWSSPRELFLGAHHCSTSTVTFISAIETRSEDMRSIPSQRSVPFRLNR